MALSYLIYTGLLLLCWMFACFASWKENKKYIWPIILSLTLISGLRNASVGLDTENYLVKFEYIADGMFQYAYGLETTFKLICYAVLKLIPSMTFLLTLLAFITNYCIISRLWELRRVSYFSTMVACCYMAFFFMSLNTIRQYCAIAILFYATRYLVKHQEFRYIFGVLVASLFHQSALIGAVLLAFGFLRWKELGGGHRLLLLGAVGCSPILLMWALQRIARYERYLSSADIDMGIVVPVKILFFLFTLLFMFRIYGKNHHFPNWKNMSAEGKNSIYLACACCLSVTSFPS